jgi:hypothetical protein
MCRSAFAFSCVLRPPAKTLHGVEYYVQYTRFIGIRVVCEYKKSSDMNQSPFVMPMAMCRTDVVRQNTPTGINTYSYLYVAGPRPRPHLGLWRTHGRTWQPAQSDAIDVTKWRNLLYIQRANAKTILVCAKQ